MVAVKVVRISDYTSWYANSSGNTYLMHEAEDHYYLDVKGVRFKIKKKDAEAIPYE